MGEKSKEIGERGEEFVRIFLQKIGWKNLLYNQSINCLSTEAHALERKKSRDTHGIDVLHLYKSPLATETLESLVISVKHSDQAYPPQKPSSTLNKHFKDLIYCLECYSASELKREQLELCKPFKYLKDIGVLFWLSSNDENYEDGDVLSKLDSYSLDKKILFKSAIYLIDNKRINFILSIISFFEIKEYQDRTLKFYYPSTSTTAQDISRSRFGDFLPVEFLTSPVIPLILKSEKESPDVDIFCIASIDDFDEQYLTMLLNVADEYTQSITCDYLFLFNDYTESKHRTKVENAKKIFGNKFLKKKITVERYLKCDFRTLK